MGTCLSKGKRSDAAVTHNASPRSSFSAGCKGDACTLPSPLRTHKPTDEIVVVVTKDSASLLANNQNSISSKKSPTVENEKLHSKKKDGEARNNLQSNSVVQGVTLSSACQGEKASLNSHSHSHSHSHEASMDNHMHEAATDANKSPSCADGSKHAAKKCVMRDNEVTGVGANNSNAKGKEGLSSIEDEFVVDESLLLLAKLKHARSCQQALRLTEINRPLRQRSFQETSTFSPRTTKLETIPEPQFGTTKYLEGLDLVDVLPHKSSHSESPHRAVCGAKGELKPTVLNLPQHESNGLSADFFTLKSRYLLSCSAASHSASICNAHLKEDDGMMLPCNAHCKEDATMRSSDIMHSQAFSLDSTKHVKMVNAFSSSRHPISAVVEEVEDECVSDDSETFEFKQAVSVYAQEPNQKKVQLRNRGEEGHGRESRECCRFNARKEVCASKEGTGLGKYKELCVVATGDAVLYAGPNSEEFDLIPSKSYVRDGPKKASNLVPSNQKTYHNSHKGHDDDDEEQHPQRSHSVDDIILLLERDELDEDMLFSILNFAKSSTSTSHGSGNMPSCHTSDVASEASFEFKVKSSCSTPHSTPSTPMLSAGSTPKRITQLNPLALTSEEIAEIWGVFEQRQALSSFQM